jgi:hypothetical protein
MVFFYVLALRRASTPLALRRAKKGWKKIEHGTIGHVLVALSNIG